MLRYAVTSRSTVSPTAICRGLLRKLSAGVFLTKLLPKAVPPMPAFPRRRSKPPLTRPCRPSVRESATHPATNSGSGGELIVCLGMGRMSVRILWISDDENRASGSVSCLLNGAPSRFSDDLFDPRRD
jgi:hypothetical protein